MPDTIRCDDCGHENPPGRESCERCNFPMRAPAVTGALAPAPEASDEASYEASQAPPAPTSPAAPLPQAPQETGPPPRPLPFRPLRRPARPLGGNQHAATMWLVFGAFAAIVVLYTAIQANVQRAQAPVEGAREDQQKRVDAFREILAKDSTNVEARIGLADILYDTGNWSDAIIHYSSALAKDSSRVTAMVDLGVCYYNLGKPERAVQLFKQSLQKDPHHPVALFNLGIVAESQQKWDESLEYFHRALQSSPPDNMQQPLMEAMQRVLQKSGKSAPPIPGGS